MPGTPYRLATHLPLQQGPIMPINPAKQLHQAWDNLFKLTLGPRQVRHLSEHLPVHTHVDIDERPYLFERWGSYPQMIDHRTGFQAVAQDANGAYIYTMGFLYNGRVAEPLFQLDAAGNFRLGSSFNSYCTRGTFDRVQNHTFLGTNRTSGNNAERIWWFRGFDSDQMWCNHREWRSHTYYWGHKSVGVTTWLQLVPVGGSWRVDVSGGAGNYVHARSRLMQEYRNAEDYYAKWRRKYYREHNLPDPERKLNASDIQTVDYIAQHLRVYDPPKARMPS